MRAEVKYALDEIDACKEIRSKTENPKVKAQCNTRIKKFKAYLKELGYTKRI
jgi:hypothetical protein